ncbi:MAG: flagellar biosynthesis protein FliQ [Fibrobacterota bacterium]|nr:flagellar biosynthesis protein FliQ [Fibrobacterota bacterium]QQS03555.1 MAG: flagellar biosynthesis protein FliQ [Fibrobacterota bacterium]
MSEGDIIALVRETLWVSLALCAPVLVVTLVVGLILSILQTATSISEATLTFLPKLIAGGLAAVFAFPWMLHLFRDYFTHMISLFRSIHA